MFRNPEKSKQAADEVREGRRTCPGNTEAVRKRGGGSEEEVLQPQSWESSS